MRRDECRSKGKEVEVVRRAIEAWRQARVKGAAMPAELWAAAAALAQEQGIFPVARALGVDYAALKRHVAAAGEVASDAGAADPSCDFFEVQATQFAMPLVGDGAPAAAVGATVEMWAADGARMMIRLPECGAADAMVRLADAFWRRAA